MKIISAKQDGQDVSSEVIAKDIAKIKRIHKESLKKEALWKFFGGIITIGNRQYQVV